MFYFLDIMRLQRDLLQTTLQSQLYSHFVGCNNGGGCGYFSKVKRLLAKSIGTQKQLFSGFFVELLRFKDPQNFSPRHILHINPYMHICPCSWALTICKNIGIRAYFGSVAVESVGVFCHFALWRHGTKLATFFIAPKNRIF